MAIKGYSTSLTLQHYWILDIRLFSVISETLVGEVYPSAETQSVYSKAQADRALFTSMFICFFWGWSIGAFGFRKISSGVWGERLFSLFLTIFGGGFGDLFDICFVRDFVFLRELVFCLTGQFAFFFFCYFIGFHFDVTFISLVCASVLWISAECRFFRCSWNFGQSFGSNWISFSTRTLYLSALLQHLIGFILWATEA